jgi:hypothetical protein
LYIEKMTPSEMLAAHPNMQSWVDSSLVEGKYTSGLHYTFVQQLTDKNLAAAWDAWALASAGHALAMWGSAEFITGRDDHELIARIVNARAPGRAEVVVFDGVDHGFFEAATPAASFAEWGKPGRTQSPRILEALRAWSERVARARG